MFIFSGRIDPGSVRHSPRRGHGPVIPDSYPTVAFSAWSQWRDVPQYAETVRGKVQGYNPGGDCNGAFMYSKYLIDNNCYAYACCIATNSYAQPGRASQGSIDLYRESTVTPENLLFNAQKDGLVDLGETLASSFDSLGDGHLVGLLFSGPQSQDGVDWPGDWHWLRCDDLDTPSWSHKYGPHQVVNYDFSGKQITDPTAATWKMRYGMWGSAEIMVEYQFIHFMWVPPGVQII